ncbi:centrosome and spindle pole-associated protein 1 isoform X2 [Nothobranchius furzeri]|uniref:centrosome and spindle pole-associated protein 1 isoform X2 n=1 Tax=Nothobranchius furzeri TaxID=105023 RepID=UPI003904CAEA
MKKTSRNIYRSCNWTTKIVLLRSGDVLKNIYNFRNCEPQVLEHQGLSLPINERASIKGRLREERKKEYNIFLQEQAQKRRSKRGTPPISSKASQGSPSPFLSTQTNSPPPPLHKEQSASCRDAATLTEGGCCRRQRRWQLRKSEKLNEETSSEEDEEDFDFRYRRRHDKEHKKKKKKTRKPRMNSFKCRAVQDLEEIKTSAPHDPSNTDGILKSHTKETPDEMRTAVRSTSATRKDEAEFATGLIIGAAEDRTVTQMKKEQYKQELLLQMAEQKGNKLKEKRLELKVAATGATDPEKQPERIQQFGAACQQHENLRRDVPHRSGTHLDVARRDCNPRWGDEKPRENTGSNRAPRGCSQVDFGSAFSQQPGNAVPGFRMRKTPGGAPFDYFNQDYHGNVTRTPDVIVPRSAPVLLPVIPDAIHDPYDASHHYGNRNSFDSHPPQNQNNLLYEAEQPGTFDITSQMQPLPVSANEAFPFAAEGLHVDRPNPRRESVLSYQEALKQQIKEREEQKRREEERYAKLEAAMMAYDPWGRGGGGAPIVDQNGDLVSDLRQMHRINNNKMSAANEAEVPFSHRLADSSHPSPSQQLSAKERYKEELKRQIEEQKRRQAEEREKIRIREEKEEEKLAKERARMQQQYEEEQRRQREAQENLRNMMTQEATTPHKAEVKRTSKERVPESAKEEKEKTSHQTYEAQQSLQREPSPPIPTLLLLPSRPSTEINQLSSRAGRSVSAPHVQRATSKVPTLYDGQQEVIRELSALRNCLRKKQNQLELQMNRTAIAHPHLDRRPPRMDAFEFVKDESHPRDSRRAEKQKQSEFNPSKQGGELRVYQQGATRPTEERCERTAPRRERAYEELSTEERGQNHQPPKATNQPGFCDPSRSARLGVPSARFTRRRPVSMETVSTEPWPHSGTSDTVKHVTHRQKPGIRSGALPWLTQRVT